MSRPMWTDRSVVYIVRTDAAFVPRSPWDCPDGFSDGQIHARNLPLEDARATVRTYNKAAMRKREADVGSWDRFWGICVACVRSKGFDRMIRVVSATLRKGGAA